MCRVISHEISVLGHFFDQKSQIQRVVFEAAILARIITLIIYKIPSTPTILLKIEIPKEIPFAQTFAQIFGCQRGIVAFKFT